MIVTLTGFMGSGKSSTGRELAGLTGYRFTDLDEYISHKAGKTIPQLLSESEERFRALEAEAVRDIFIMSRIEGFDVVLALGGGSLMNPEIQTLVQSRSTLVYLRTGIETLVCRLEGSEKDRPLLKKCAVADLMEQRLSGYGLASVIVDTDGKSPAQVAGEIYRIIK